MHHRACQYFSGKFQKSNDGLLFLGQWYPQACAVPTCVITLPVVNIALSTEDVFRHLQIRPKDKGCLLNIPTFWIGSSRKWCTAYTHLVGTSSTGNQSTLDKTPARSHFPPTEELS